MLFFSVKIFTTLLIIRYLTALSDKLIILKLSNN